MNAMEMAKDIGRTANLTIGELKIEVRIIDARKCWNRLDYLVVPVAGSGKMWKDSASLEVR